MRFLQDFQQLPIVNIPHAARSVSTSSDQPSFSCVEDHRGNRLTLMYTKLMDLPAGEKVPQANHSVLRARDDLFEFFEKQ